MSPIQVHVNLEYDPDEPLSTFLWWWHHPCVLSRFLSSRVDADFIFLYSTTVTSSEVLSGRLIQLLSFFLWQWPYALSCFSAVLGNCHFLLINTVSCSELLFGHFEPWLSYFSNVPNLSCKDRSGGYWFICRFLARVRMIISLRSELERRWTCNGNDATMSGDEDKSTPVRILHPTVSMLTRRSNMTKLFQPRIQTKKTVMKEQDWKLLHDPHGADTPDSLSQYWSPWIFT